MEAAALVATVGVEEPGLVFAEIFIVDGLLAGLHNAIGAKVVITGLSVFGDHTLKSGLQLASFVKAEALAIDCEDLYTLGCVVRTAMLNIEDKGLAFLADLRCAFHLVPAVSAFSVLLIELVGGDGRGSLGGRGTGIVFVGSSVCVGRGCVPGISVCCSVLGLCSLRQAEPSGLQDSVLEGVVGTVNLAVNLVHDHASVVVKEMPYAVLVQILILIFKLNPAGLPNTVAFLAQIVGGTV